MLKENKEKRAKNSNIHIKSSPNYYQAPQSNNFRDIYINQSPTYYNQYRYIQENPNPYLNRMHYLQCQRGPEDFYQEGDNLQKNMKNLKLKPEYYFNDFNTEKNVMQRSVNTYTNQSDKKFNEKYFIYENKSQKENNHQNDGKISNYREYGHQSYTSDRYQTPFYRNNPLRKTANYNNRINLKNSQNHIKPVAQKICNITIKGDGEMKKERGRKISGRKRQKKPYDKNIEIEENIIPGIVIPDKNINFNISPTKSKFSSSSAYYNEDDNIDYDEDYEFEENEDNENEEIEEKEEGLPISEARNMQKLRNEKINSNEGEIYRKEGEDEYEDYDENLENMDTINKDRDTLGGEEEMNGENEEREGEEGEIDDGIGIKKRNNKIVEKEEDQEIEDGHEQVEDVQIEQGEQIEQLEDDDGDEINDKMIENENEDENNRINKAEIEE